MISIKPTGPVRATITVPGSKSITQRALIIAALAEGTSTIVGPLESEDTSYSSRALEQLGCSIAREQGRWVVAGTGGRISAPDDDIYLGNNGTATRFLTSVAALGSGEFIIDGDERMQQRPIEPLLDALRGWGVDIVSIRENGCPPLSLRADGIAGGRTRLPEGRSSQYLSSLLLVGPLAKKRAELEVAGTVMSRPYVEMTLRVMFQFGVRVEAVPDFSFFAIAPDRYRPCVYQIEGDASNASYFWAAAAITGGTVTVDNVPVPSLQGDAMLVPLLARMGCEVNRQGGGISITGPRRLEGIRVDMGDMPDVAPTLAVVAAFAEGPTEITNIAHLRIKECDRLSAVAAELGKIGARVEEFADRLIIHGDGGKGLHGARIETYNDHRMAMSMAVAGLRLPGVEIDGEHCVMKSFPGFWETFSRLMD